MDDEHRSRAARHAALSDPTRLAIVDELSASDRSPHELQRRFGVTSNLLAHHLDVLEAAGLILRERSSGDGRRRYVHLRADGFADLAPVRRVPVGPALFVCSANSARSQLAAALWTDIVGQPASSAGTRPAERVHPGAVAAARRAGLDLAGAVPRRINTTRDEGLVVTVCDRAHEELAPGPGWLHWSIADPVPLATRAAFDATVSELRSRIVQVAA
jgi:protein-tyrosine-phosphatase/DNA-binding HxlR family transcriptional regulator